MDQRSLPIGILDFALLVVLGVVAGVMLYFGLFGSWPEGWG